MKKVTGQIYNQKWSEIPQGQSPFGTFDVGEVVKDILTNINNPVLGTIRK